MLAVMVAVPAATPVAAPEELTVATDGADDVQVTWSVTSWVVAGWLFPWLVVPVAANCTVPPVATDCVGGETWMLSTSEFPPQPASNSAAKPAISKPTHDKPVKPATLLLVRIA